jgi:hypothetical protein
MANGKRGRPKKNPFDDLDADFKDSVDGKSDSEINEMIAKVAKDEELNRRHKADDEDLKERQEQAKLAGAVYAEATKAYKLKTAYLYDVLKARGLEP